MAFITGYVRVKGREVMKNGSPSFSCSPDTGLDEFLEQFYGYTGAVYPKFYKMDRMCRAGFTAAELLLRDSGISEYKVANVGVILANATGSQGSDMRYLEASAKAPSPALFVYTLPNIVAGEICIRHRFGGENAFFVSPAFEGETLAQYTGMVMNDAAEACVGGWVDTMDDHCDVFLYLIENKPAGTALVLSGRQLETLYQ